MKILNKKAKFNYKLFERFEAGISLVGGEVKAIKKGSIDLSQSYAKVINNEVYLVNANIPIAGKQTVCAIRGKKRCITTLNIEDHYLKLPQVLELEKLPGIEFVRSLTKLLK